MAGHLFLEAVPVEAEILFRGHRLEQFRRETVGLVHLEGVGAGDNLPAIGLGRPEDILDASQAGVDGAEEVGLLTGDDLLNARDRFGQFRIRRLHQIGDHRNQMGQERLVHPHLNPVENRAAQKPANDVFLFFVPRVDVLVNGEGTGANVVGDTAQTAAVLVGQVVLVVLPAADFGGRQNQRLEDIDMEVRRDSLKRRGRTLQPHAGIDVFAREGLKVVGRITDAVELGED